MQCPFSAALMLNSDDFTLVQGLAAVKLLIYSPSPNIVALRRFSQKKFGRQIDILLRTRNEKKKGTMAFCFQCLLAVHVRLPAANSKAVQNCAKKCLNSVNDGTAFRHPSGLRSLSAAPSFRPCVLTRSGWLQDRLSAKVPRILQEPHPS